MFAFTELLKYLLFYHIIKMYETAKTIIFVAFFY